MPSDYEEWLATRPKCVQELAAKFPPMTRVMKGGITHYVIGYGDDEDGTPADLIVSTVDPCDDYEGAIAASEHICSECVKELT